MWQVGGSNKNAISADKRAMASLGQELSLLQRPCRYWANDGPCRPNVSISAIPGPRHVTPSGRWRMLVGVQPAGRSFEVQRIHIYRLVNDTIADHFANREAVR